MDVIGSQRGYITDPEKLPQSYRDIHQELERQRENLKLTQSAYDALEKELISLKDLEDQDLDYQTEAKRSLQKLLSGLKTEEEHIEKLQTFFSRWQKKVPFFGDVSNGKSATLNGLLGTPVLPARSGHTTDALLRLSGWSRATYRLAGGGEEWEVTDVTTLQRILKEQTGSGRRRDRECVPVFSLEIPSDLHGTVGCDTILLDCPGSNNTSTFDDALRDNCQDADVMVVVIDATRRLSKSEKTFLKSAAENVGTPELFFVVNKWDLVPADERDENMSKCEENIKRFVTQELSKSINPHIHFISAKKHLAAKAKGDTNPYTEVFATFEQSLQDVIKQRKEQLMQGHLAKAVESSQVIKLTVDKMMQKLEDHRRDQREAMQKNRDTAFISEVESLMNSARMEFYKMVEQRYIDELITLRDLFKAAARNKLSEGMFEMTVKEVVTEDLPFRVATSIEDTGHALLSEHSRRIIDILSTNLEGSDSTTFKERARAFSKERLQELKVGETQRMLKSINQKSWLKDTISITEDMVSTIADLVHTYMATSFQAKRGEGDVGTRKEANMNADGSGKTHEDTARESEKTPEEEKEFQNVIEMFRDDVFKPRHPQSVDPSISCGLTTKLGDVYTNLIQIRSEVVQGSMQKESNQLDCIMTKLIDIQSSVSEVQENLAALS